MKTIKSIKTNLPYILLSLILIYPIIMWCISVQDADLFYMLNEGHLIIDDSIQYYNSSFVLPDFHIIIQQWAWDVILYGINSMVGIAGIYILAVAMTVTAFFLIVKLAKIKNASTKTAFILSVIIFIINKYIFSYEASMGTMILLLIQLILTEKYKSTGRYGYLATMLPLVIIDTNIHMSMWAFHVVFLIPYAFPPIKNMCVNFRERTHKAVPVMVTMLAMIPCSFINPYGTEGSLYLFKSYNKSLNSLSIGELQPPIFLSKTGILAVVGLILIAWLCIKKKEIECEYVYMFFGTLILALLHLRNIWYFQIAICLIVIELLKGKDLEKFIEFFNRQTAGVTLVFMLGLALTVVYETGSKINELKDSKYEHLRAVVDVLDNDCKRKDARVFTDLNSGSYLRYRGYTSCYIDGRPELYMKAINKKEDIVKEYIDLYSKADSTLFEKFKDRYQWEYYVYEKDLDYIDLHVQYSGFEKIAEDGAFVLYKAKN